ncbi:beta transducin-like protein [Ilyonectria robusta]
MRLINVETLRLESFVGDKIPPYAILSHTWGADADEISFEDIEKRNIAKSGSGIKKLKGSCNQAKQDHLKYVWIDTCCINKDSSKELDEAINSMFQWYLNATVCYTYLSDVPQGDHYWDPDSKFFSSRWFQRGWTLQELLAPQTLRFYDQDWILIGTKADMSTAIEAITGISRQFLCGWEDLRQASVAQRMSWAAKRQTSRKEDIAYCLLGIFDVTMPMIYGEGDRALSRLQQEIIKHSRDYSILAWGLDTAEDTPSKPTDMISAGILAPAPSDFANCGRIAKRKQDTAPVTALDISGGRLRISLPLHTTSAGEMYGLLNCGPEHDADQIVGVPLYNDESGTAPNEYLRPQERCSVLLPRTALSTSTKRIHIQMERQSRTDKKVARRFWLHIDGHQKINLKLEEDYPPVSWKTGRALIAETTKPDGLITRRYMARFRTKGEASRDIIVVLELEIDGLQRRTRSHIMTSSRDTDLEDLFQKFIYIRPEALGKQTANNGMLTVGMTVNEEQVAQEHMFVVRLAPVSSSPDAPVAADLELHNLNLRLEFVRILGVEDQLNQETKRLLQRREVETSTLDQMRKRLGAKEEQLRILNEEMRSLREGIEKETQSVDRLTNRLNVTLQEQDECAKRESEIQQRLDELETKEGPGNWFETTIQTQLDAEKAAGDLNDAEDLGSDRPPSSRAAGSGPSMHNQTPILWAASTGREAVARLLLEKGANFEANDDHRNTPLHWAAANGDEAIATLLLDRGANIEAKSNDSTTPLFAAIRRNEAVVRLLLDRGANIEARSESGHTPLLHAVIIGCETVTRLLLEKEANFEANDKDRNTPLHLAAANGHEAIATLLLDRGANIEAKNNNNLTPLLAAFCGNEAVVRLLLDRGANIESRSTGSITPLFVAAFRGDEAVIRLLLEKGANIEARTKNGYTPLLHTAREGCETAVRLLLEKGANLEAKEKYRNTPLHLAAGRGHEGVSRLLLDKGANVDTKNKGDHTALHYALANNHRAVADLLIEKGAKEGE